MLEEQRSLPRAQLVPGFFACQKAAPAQDAEADACCASRTPTPCTTVSAFLDFFLLCIHPVIARKEPSTCR